MLALADRLGAAHLVTGHYARTLADPEGTLLAPAADAAKDQSYMLAALPPALLARLRFPLAERSKPEVRSLAERHGLAVARKPESQDLCFLAGEGKRAFLRRHGGLGDREGDLLDRNGRAVGRHRGHHHFTVGQRRGIGVRLGPAPLRPRDRRRREHRHGRHRRPSWRAARSGCATRCFTATAAASTRSGFATTPRRSGAAIEGGAGAGRHDRLRLSLARPFAGPAPGQTAVLLRGEAIVGHATIAA